MSDKEKKVVVTMHNVKTEELARILKERVGNKIALSLFVKMLNGDYDNTEPLNLTVEDVRDGKVILSVPLDEVAGFNDELY